eukprot:g30099.t1
MSNQSYGHLHPERTTWNDWKIENYTALYVLCVWLCDLCQVLWRANAAAGRAVHRGQILCALALRQD